MQIKSPVDIYHLRVKFFRIIVIIAFLIIFAKYWHLQLIQGPEYFILSEKNRIRVSNIPAPRGIMLDRFGKIIARNRPSYNIVFYRQDVQSSLPRIAKFLDLDINYLKDILKKYSDVPISEPVILKEDIPFENVAFYEPRLIDYPNLAINVEPVRFYPFTDKLVHVVGYVGEISNNEIISAYYHDVTSGDLVGKTGIEKKYNQYLNGKKGQTTDVVDSLGHKVETLIRSEPESGYTVQLTIDSELQSRIYDLMEDKVGAVVVVDPNTGEILAMVSNPSYDPNQFIGRFTIDKWNELINVENDPLQNRTIQNTYSPGSMFKIVLALAALEDKTISNQTRYSCEGIKYFYRQPRRCNNPSGHGSIALYDAIRLSCNIYFYTLGDKLGIEKIYNWATRFGFSQITAIDLVEEKSGLIPNESWKQRTFNEPWYPGETISVAIGQGAVQITVLQQALFISAIANGGKIYKPYIVKKISDKSNKLLLVNTPKEAGTLGVSEENLENVKKAMWGVVNDYGTGWGAKIWGKAVAGKTGTAQVVQKDTYLSMEEIPWNLRNHSWFSCYANLENPEVTVVVLVEHGGDGSAVAAPLAGKILREYFKLQKERKQEENNNGHKEGS